MKIDFYCHPPSPSFRFFPPDIWGRGLGGAELSLVSLAETLAKRGHRVTVYCEPPEQGCYNGVYYLNAVPFYVNKPRDVFVLYRNPYPFIEDVRASCKIFWSCDQMTAGNYASDIYPYVDKAVCISEYHKKDHMARYNVEADRIAVIDLGVRLQDYERQLPKQQGKFIFCSAPHRGLPQLVSVFLRIKERCPWATLHITFDYRLWGRGIAPLDDDMRRMVKDMRGVFYYGKLPRKELIAHQLTADLLVYPHWPVNGLPELFGVSIAECMAAGVVPVISNIGALPLTVGDAGIIVKGDPRSKKFQQKMADIACDLLQDRDKLEAMQAQARAYAFQRFDWNVIAQKWEALFEECISEER